MNALEAITKRKFLILALLPFIAFWFTEFAQYKHLPGPLYGGDLYQQMGIMMHIYTGNAPWEDSQFQGEWAFRDWMMHFLAAVMAWVLGAVAGVKPIIAFVYWPLIPMVLGGVAAFGIGRKMFDNDAIAALLAVAWMGIPSEMGATSSSFGTIFAVPLFFYALISLNDSLKSKVLLGVAYGFAGLSYLVAFFGNTLMLALLFAYRAFGSPKAALHNSSVKVSGIDATGKSFWKQLKFFLPVALVSAPIVLALWGPVLYVYHGDVKNPSHFYGDNARGFNFTQAIGIIQDLFFSTSKGWFWGVITIASLGGVFAAVRQWDSNGGKWTMLLFAVGMLGTYHYLITMPLFNNHLVYYRYPKLFLQLAQLLFFFHGVSYVHSHPRFDSYKKPLLAATLAVLAVGSYSIASSALQPGTFSERAKELDAAKAAKLEAGEWILANTPREAVFLTLAHQSFAVNGLTGRKIVVNRRTHANTFVDLDKRFADAAVMIYGENKEKSLELMDAYGVQYAYVDHSWDSDLPTATDPEYAAYWAENGIEFAEGKLPHDPIGNSLLFDVIAVENAGLESVGPAFSEEFEAVFTKTDGSGNAIVSVLKRKNASK